MGHYDEQLEDWDKEHYGNKQKKVKTRVVVEDGFVLNRKEVEVFQCMIGSMSRREILLYLNEKQFDIIHKVYTDGEEYLA